VKEVQNNEVVRARCQSCRKRQRRLVRLGLPNWSVDMDDGLQWRPS
jgi:hypothetical protein